MENSIIEPKKGFNFPSIKDIKEIYDYREILFFLVWRDIKVRYKQTKIGLLWIIFQPLLSIAIYTLFFGLIIKVPSKTIPYPIFFMSAYIVWLLVYEGVSRSLHSIITNAGVITQVYFPRIIIPLASVISPIFDFMISFVILLILLPFFGYGISINIIFLPLIILYVTLLSLGIGMWLCSLNVSNRDFQLVVPYLMQLWSYCSPMVYPQELVPQKYIFLYQLNPLVWVISAMRWVVVGISENETFSIYMSFVIVTIIFISGYMYFKHNEHTFADVL